MVIFDLDGCLSDDRNRLELKEYGWHTYHKHLADDPCINFRRYEKHFNQGDFIAIITARPWDFVRPTRNWLESNRINCDFLFMRPVGDTRTSPVLKVEMARKLRHLLKEDIKMAYDDREDVIRAYIQAGIPAMLLDINTHHLNKE